jgi:hypothetical protein
VAARVAAVTLHLGGGELSSDDEVVVTLLERATTSRPGQGALSQRSVPGACSEFDFQFDFNTRSEPINDPDQAIDGETCQIGVADT